MWIDMNRMGLQVMVPRIVESEGKFVGKAKPFARPPIHTGIAKLLNLFFTLQVIQR